jgi:RNA polymerase sigma factor FliA
VTEADYLPFVRQIAYAVAAKARLSAADRDDLVGSGALALVGALRRYDPSRGVKVETFATYSVRGAMIDYLRGLDPLGRDMRRRVQREDLPQPWTPVNEIEAVDVPASAPDLDRQIAVQERQTLARHLLMRVPARERRVLVGVFWQERTQRAIASNLGVNASRISQLRTRALKRLRAVA